LVDVTVQEASRKMQGMKTRIRMSRMDTLLDDDG